MASVTHIKPNDLQLIKVIGEGGFSSVYEAKWRQSDLTQQVAAKRLHKIDKHELEVLSQLDHPNIVKLLGVVDEKCDFMLVMELCKGGSLRSYLDKTKGTRLSWEQFIDWAKQAATPIKYLKEMKIVHKDIKSLNYLIADGNVLKLGDFGSAKNIDVTMSNATSTASYGWMAPELLKDQKLSPSYDIHSYGVVVWELWTFEIPFEGCEPMNIMWRVCSNNERPPIPEDCPKPIADLMRQCWEVDWHKRPSIDNILTVLNDAGPVLIQKQILDGPWVLEKEFGRHGPGKLSSAWGIAVNPNGDVAVADQDAAQVKVYSSEGEYKLSLDTTQGLTPGDESNPLGVTVSSEGNYYVTNTTQYVKVYDVKGMYKDKWAAISPDNKPSDTEYGYLWGLAMDSKGQLLVGVITDRYISKHRQDGSHIASVKVDIDPCYLSVTSQDAIIVGDFIEDVVQIIDNTGQMLHTVKPPTDVTQWDPMGVCCHEDIVLICSHARGNNGSIHCFSVSGEYLRKITVEAHPHCLTFVKETKKLMVSYEKKVQIYSIKE